ncbi:MAG: hypothetical protein KDK55_06685 [Chlamydiia bacterium]|nr:hypothetical protein [Chlamydiia bacterium]
MNYKITGQIVCLPPHISTTWEQIAFLETEEDKTTQELILAIHLVNGKVVKIPGLDTSVIDILFSAHVKFLEKRGKGQNEEKTQNPQAAFLQNVLGLSPDQLSSLSIRLGPGGMGGMMAGGLEGLETTMQHDPEKSDAPNLPKEMIEKVASIAKLLLGGDLKSFPKPEPHCNCMHCQISRAILNGDKIASESDEEVITEEDLKFRTWDIKQTGDQLYRVTNPLTPSEKYDVFLGSPIGCTCGNIHCEHIKAVLSS